jgi:hypothetical protein
MPLSASPGALKTIDRVSRRSLRCDLLSQRPIPGHHLRRGVDTIFRETVPIRVFPLSFDAPIFASVDTGALVLSLAAAFAIFRCKAGMMLTMAACCLAGIGLYLARTMV